MVTISSDLSFIAAAISSGQVVAVPTDTVYGICASIDHPEAIGKIYGVKARPAGLALPVLVADRAAAEELVGPMPPAVLDLVRRGWPGALTVVVPCNAAVATAVGGNGTLGVRVPDSDLLRALLRLTGPLATTSCNRHGEDPAFTAEEAAVVLGDDGLVLRGPSGQGVASTVIEVRGEELIVLRRGGFDLG
ncbi:MAG: L-threonylcarbamoyladenylate synthase [Actinomycetota bacterium]